MTSFRDQLLVNLRLISQDVKTDSIAFHSIPRRRRRKRREREKIITKIKRNRLKLAKRKLKSNSINSNLTNIRKPVFDLAHAHYNRSTDRRIPQTRGRIIGGEITVASIGFTGRDNRVSMTSVETARGGKHNKYRFPSMGIHPGGRRRRPSRPDRRGLN